MKELSSKKHYVHHAYAYEEYFSFKTEGEGDIKLNAVLLAGCLLIIVPKWTKPGFKLKYKTKLMLMLIKNLSV